MSVTFTEQERPRPPLRSPRKRVQIPPDATPSRVRAFMAATIIQAIVDLHSRDELRALDSLLWLTGPDIGLWLAAAGMDEIDTLALLRAGRLQWSKAFDLRRWYMANHAHEK